MNRADHALSEKRETWLQVGRAWDVLHVHTGGQGEEGTGTRKGAGSRPGNRSEQAGQIRSVCYIPPLWYFRRKTKDITGRDRVKKRR